MTSYGAVSMSYGAIQMSFYLQSGSKQSKLLILSKYDNKTEKIGGTWTNTNSYRENEALCDIFTWNILRHSCFMFKYFITQSSQ